MPYVIMLRVNKVADNFHATIVTTVHFLSILVSQMDAQLRLWRDGF